MLPFLAVGILKYRLIVPVSHQPAQRYHRIPCPYIVNVHQHVLHFRTGHTGSHQSAQRMLPLSIFAEIQLIGGEEGIDIIGSDALRKPLEEMTVPEPAKPGRLYRSGLWYLVEGWRSWCWKKLSHSVSL